MKTAVLNNGPAPAHGYRAEKTQKPINFFCFAPGAKTVYLMGDFNDWNPASLPMQRRPEGWWVLQVELPHGYHQYQFLVDGTPTLDPHATGSTRNSRYAQVSLIAVS